MITATKTRAATETSQTLDLGLVWGVMAVLSACVLAFAFRTRDYFVDDAFIGFQYIGNLMAGHGFVFHAGDTPVEGVTNIGWLLLLAPFSNIASPMVLAKLAGLALVLSTLLLTLCLGQRLAMSAMPGDDSFGLVLPPVLMLVSSFEFVYFSLAGMETALLATLLMLMCCIALRRPHAKELPVLAAAAFLVHPEAVAVLPLYSALCWFWSKQDRHKVLVDNLILAGLVGGITLIRFTYFGDILPNTFYSKPSDMQTAIQNVYAFLMGQNTNVAFPITGWLSLPLLLLGYLRLRKRTPAAADMLAATCATGLLLAIYSLPDWTALPRYFAPYLPAALILFWDGLNRAIQLFIAPPRIRQLTSAAIMVLLVLAGMFDGQRKMARMDDYPGYVLSGKNLIEPALWLRDHVPADATIASRRIGALAYYSERPVFDYMYGLPDRQVARLISAREFRFDTPTDPMLAAVWRERAPEYLLEDGPVIDSIAAQSGGTRQRFSIHGIEYRVVEKFTIGNDAQWVLARRVAAK